MIFIDFFFFSSCYTFKTWWKPRVSFSATASYVFDKAAPVFGGWVVFDTVDKLEHEVAQSTFKDSVGYSVVDYIPIDDEEFV